MLRGATCRAAEIVGTAVLRIVVSSDSMKNANATSHGSSRLLAAEGASETVIPFEGSVGPINNKNTRPWKLSEGGNRWYSAVQEWHRFRRFQSWGMFGDYTPGTENQHRAGARISLWRQLRSTWIILLILRK